jgi:RimJ/RimL family protein N-acetyltransferase
MERETVQIRAITLEDTHGFWECVSEVAKERKFLSFVEAPPIEMSRNWVEKLRKADFPHFVAVDRGNVVGWIDIAPLGREMFSHVGQLGMGLLADYRGKGLGTRLMEVALARAWEIGLERVELDVYPSNATAIHLYEKFGFQLEGSRRKAKKMDGVHEDVLIMGLLREEREV